jgi:hypothetical protein
MEHQRACRLVRDMSGTRDELQFSELQSQAYLVQEGVLVIARPRVKADEGAPGIPKTGLDGVN